MLGIVAILVVAVGGAMTGSAILVHALMGDHPGEDDRTACGRLTALGRLRERVLLRWDTTRRLR